MSVKEKPRIASTGIRVNSSDTRKDSANLLKTQSPSMRIYFAGKIGEYDWRTKLFGYRIGGVYEERELFDPNFTIDMGGGVIYGGPFFVSCDHGCAHGPSSHGVGADGHELGGCGSFDGRTRRDIFEINNERIRRADYIFAYLDSFTAYGTLVEIGYAYASGIPIVVALSPTLEPHGHDLWYAGEAARFSILGEPKPAFALFCRALGLPWRHRSARRSATANTGPSLFGVHPGSVPWLR